jgi:uncharacterized protein YndB with AHSA1/START domain
LEPLRSDIIIEAPRRVVWGVLADLEAVAAWNPTIDRVECVGDVPLGPGARRRCYMHPSGWVTEVLGQWEHGRLITFEVEDALPLKSGVGRFVLMDHGFDTRLQAGFDYQVRLGPLGPVIDRLVVHRQLSSNWHQTIEALRSHAEALAHTGGTT